VELITYLNEYFFTKQQLLEISKVSEQDMFEYQEKGVMPKCSYKLTLNLASDSFLGSHQAAQTIEYYAKGYSSWLAIIQSLNCAEDIQGVFVKRYKAAIEKLKEQGHASNDPKINAGFDQHIEQEWGYFLEGVYGLCTKSGLPEDIAAKEFAIIEIDALSEQTQLEEAQLNEAQLNQLTKAVNRLDSASSFFAPHERLKSSRHRLVNEIRRKYRLAL
jgi:hypothetical protein